MNWIGKLEVRTDRFDTRAYITVEKTIFYSAFIMRKLFDCKTKVTKQTMNSKIKIMKYEVNPERINLVRRYTDEEVINKTNVMVETVPLRRICNALIHSAIFDVLYDSNRLIGFFVASDIIINQKKPIYFIRIEDWISSAKLVVSDQTKTLYLTYSEAIKDYTAEAN